MEKLNNCPPPGPFLFLLFAVSVLAGWVTVWRVVSFDFVGSIVFGAVGPLLVFGVVLVYFLIIKPPADPPGGKN